MSDCAIPLDEAVQRLEVSLNYDAGNGPEPCVHTFIQSAFGLLGAHWSVESLVKTMRTYGVEEADEQAIAMGHGLVVKYPSGGPLFIATRPI